MNAAPWQRLPQRCCEEKTQKKRKKLKKELDKISNDDILCSISGGGIAQLVEQGTENPCVPGSIPGPATIFFVLMPFGHTKRLFYFLFYPKIVNDL